MDVWIIVLSRKLQISCALCLTSFTCPMHKWIDGWRDGNLSVGGGAAAALIEQMRRMFTPFSHTTVWTTCHGPRHHTPLGEKWRSACKRACVGESLIKKTDILLSKRDKFHWKTRSLLFSSAVVKASPPQDCGDLVSLKRLQQPLCAVRWDVAVAVHSHCKKKKRKILTFCHIINEPLCPVASWLFSGIICSSVHPPERGMIS